MLGPTLLLHSMVCCRRGLQLTTHTRTVARTPSSVPRLYLFFSYSSRPFFFNLHIYFYSHLADLITKFIMKIQLKYSLIYLDLISSLKLLSNPTLIV